MQPPRKVRISHSYSLTNLTPQDNSQGTLTANWDPVEGTRQWVNNKNVSKSGTFTRGPRRHLTYFVVLLSNASESSANQNGGKNNYNQLNVSFKFLTVTLVHLWIISDEQRGKYTASWQCPYLKNVFTVGLPISNFSDLSISASIFTTFTTTMKPILMKSQQ